MLYLFLIFIFCVVMVLIVGVWIGDKLDNLERKLSHNENEIKDVKRIVKKL